jgi:hypothetical protein
MKCFRGEKRSVQIRVNDKEASQERGMQLVRDSHKKLHVDPVNSHNNPVMSEPLSPPFCPEKKGPQEECGVKKHRENLTVNLSSVPPTSTLGLLHRGSLTSTSEVLDGV